MQLNKLQINKHNGVLIILVLILGISGIYSPAFIKPNNLLTMLRQASALGILTIGQLFVIMGGGVDLSLEATLQMGITIFMFGFNNYGDAGLYVGLAAAILFGALAGLANGIVVTRYHVQPFLATLFTGSIITGLRLIWVGIESAGNVPDFIRFFGRDKTFSIPNAAIVFLIVAIAAAIFIKRAKFGRKLIAVGTNFETAEYAGIKAGRVVIKSYMISGVLAVLASVVLSGYTGFADRWIGDGLSFNSLIAAVIGGNYLGGGRGSVLGVIGGALLMTIVINFVTLLGFSAPYQHIVSGLVLIITIFLGSYRKNVK